MDGKFLIFVGVGLFIYAAGYLAWLDKNKRLNEKQIKKQNRHVLMIFVSAIVVIVGVFNGINIRPSEASPMQLIKPKICSICSRDVSNERDVTLLGNDKYECKRCLTKLENEENEEESSDPYENVLCQNCKLGKYHNGFCFSCHAASPYKVYEHKQSMPNCVYCRGTGIERTGFGEQRICPVCNGSGKVRY